MSLFAPVFPRLLSLGLLVLSICSPLLALKCPPVLAQSVKNALVRPQLNGMSTYDNMGKTYYLVGFYTSQSCTDAQTCLDQQTPTRFLLKIVTPRWTASNYSLMWQTDLAMNNQETLKGDDIKALIDFTQLAETPLTVGDEIDVSYESQYTTVAVNKVIAIRTKNKTLFNYISRVWLGPTPPSKQFQADLLVGHGGQIDARLNSEFEQIKPSPKRLSLLDNWDISKKTLATEQRQADALAAKEKAKEKALAEQKALQQEKIKTLKKEKAQDELTTLKKLADAVSETGATGATGESVAIKTDKPPIKNIDKKAALATAKAQITEAINRNVIYPEWAKQFAQQNKITVSFTLNQLTELVSIDDTQPVHAGLLGEAVINAIKKTLPTVVTKPEYLPEQWQMDFQYNFVLSDATTTSSATKTANTTQPTDTTFTLANTTEGSRVADIAANIVYPYWARNLNQGGNVTIQFFIDVQGYISHYNIINGSKYPGLNDAVINAAQKTAPFNSQQIQAEYGALEFSISHDFQP